MPSDPSKGLQLRGSKASDSSGAKANPFDTTADGRRQNKLLHPSMRPIAGINETPGQYTTGRMYNVDPAASYSAKNVNKYAFNFMYNPNQISIDTQVNWDINYDPRGKFTTLPNAQTLSFQLMLNRINDVQDTRPQFKVTNGTLYDLEYLYATINGDPTVQNGISSSDFGFLVPTQLQVVFGPRFSFVGYITDLAIQHDMFQRNMIPVYTTVSISMSRALGNVGDTPADPSATVTYSPGNGSKTGGGQTGY
jgi:hypothetical protein